MNDMKFTTAGDYMSDVEKKNLGDDLFKKAIFIGMMANKLLNVMLKRYDVDDRDSYTNKRIETPGTLLTSVTKKMTNKRRRTANIT